MYSDKFTAPQTQIYMSPHNNTKNLLKGRYNIGNAGKTDFTSSL